MKIISLILSLYFVSLACLPCSDAKNVRFISDNQTTILTSENHNLSHQKDGCTPLCICSCCHINTFTPAESSQLITFVPLAESVPAYSNFYIKEIFLSFWQPPKIQC